MHWYGVMVALGFAAGLWPAARRAPRAGMTADLVFDIGPWIIIGAIIGARFLYVVSYWDRQFAGKAFTEVFMVHHGGLVYYGGLIGASVACVVFSVVKKTRLWRIADVLAPSIALGSVFGRIGCLLNGCCYGRVCALPWGIQFPTEHETHPAHVHPTQIYDSALNLVFYAGLEWLFRRGKFDGHVFSVYLIGYAVIRSAVEFFRGDYPARYLGGWATPAHIVSIGILATGVILFLLLRRGAKTGVPA